MDQNPQSQERQPAISLLGAVMLGQLFVNVPVIMIILAVFFIVGMLFPLQPWISLVVALIMGWSWWAFAVRRWRTWAINRGVSPIELTRIAVFSGLARPSDWYHLDEDDDDKN